MSGRYLRLPNGTTWPRPAELEDDTASVGWLLVYAPERMTREDQLHAASIIDAYNYLVTTPSAMKALPEIRRTIRAVTAHHRIGNGS